MHSPTGNPGNDRCRNTTLFCALALMLAACSKGTPESAKPRESAQAPPPKYEASVPAIAPEANEALKERLARQEAATRLFDKPRPQPAPAAKLPSAGRSAQWLT